MKFVRRSVSCFLGVCMLLCSSLLPALAKSEEDKSEMYELLPHIQAYLKEKNPQKITSTNFGKQNVHTYNRCFKRLKELGYIVAGNSQYEWRGGFEKNIYLFAQQMELGKEHEKELTPLVQALLLAGDDAQPIIVQGVINAEYVKDDGNPYSGDAILKQKVGKKVCLQGEVVSVKRVDDETYQYVVSGDTHQFTVDYKHPLRSSMFLVGDLVNVYGTIAVANDPAGISVDLIAFAKE